MGDVIELVRAKTVTITLTRDEAMALDALTGVAMECLISDPSLRKKHRKLGPDLESAASASDKLRQSYLAAPDPLPWKQLLPHMRRE